MTSPGSYEKRRRNDEEQLQRSIVAYLRLAAPKAMYFAVPNGEYRSKATGGRLKAMGVRAGVADLCFLVKGGYAAFLELKVQGGRQSPAQIAFEVECSERGVSYVVVTSFDQAVSVLKGWGVVR